MTLTVRLSPQLRQQLDSYCKSRSLTKTRLITELLSEHLASNAKDGGTPYELARTFGVIGSFSSAQGDLAENRKHYLKQKLSAKHSR